MTKLTKEIVNNRLLKDGRGVKLIGDHINTNSKSLFQCDKGHSWFSLHNNILKGHGCPDCGGSKRLTKEVINERLIKLGNNIKLIGDYINTNSKSLFQCDKGHSWSTKVSHIIHSGKTCPYCSGRAFLNKDIINKRLSHRGILMIDEYNNIPRVKFLFKCAKNHTWRARVSSVVNSSSNCPVCTRNGFNPDKKATLYYLNIEGTNVFKIGITNRTIDKRFKTEKRKLKVIKTWNYKNGSDAYDIEQFIIKHYSQYKYNGKKLMNNGNTELFNRDILKLKGSEK